MGLLSKLFIHKDPEHKVGGMEDFMTLIRVYFQASMAASLGITNLSMLPDLRTFKMTLHVPTVNNKLGIGEKNRCKKMLQSLYKANDDFFKEIDNSIKKNCRKVQDVQTYLYRFQGFSQDIMMLTGNLMKYKLRMPSIFKKTIYSMTKDTVDDIFTKNTYKDASVMKTVLEIRQLDNHLNFSRKWITDFVFQVVMLAKKEPRTKEDDSQKKQK
jgi:hypothetical protein